MEKKRHSSNLSTLWIILRLFSAIGSKGTFNELKISYPTVYDMNKFDNLHFRHFRQFLCAEACAVQECQTSLTDKLSLDKTPHRQNVIGQNATQSECYKTKCHRDKISQDKTPQGQIDIAEIF